MANDSNEHGVSASTLTFAHLSDAHLTSPLPSAATELCNKRLLSYIAWRRHRRHIHDPAILDRLVVDLKRSGAEHIAITGDLTHLGLATECREALDWLRKLGDPSRISLTPGNHDRLVSAPWQETVGLWADFLAGNGNGECREDGFPYLKVRGPVAFIALSSAIPTPPLMATGRLGPGQRDRLRTALEETRRRGLCRVILIHHPPVPGAYKWRKRLIDDEATAAIIEKCGAELVLHGHTHRILRARLKGPAGMDIPVVGLASASSAEAEAARAARYSLWSVVRQKDGAFRLSHRSRRHDPASARFVECSDWDPTNPERGVSSA